MFEPILKTSFYSTSKNVSVFYPTSDHAFAAYFSVQNQIKNQQPLAPTLELIPTEILSRQE